MAEREGSGRARPVEDRLADRLPAGGGPVRDRVSRALREAAAVDRAVYRAVAGTPTSTLDAPIRRLSDAANYSRIWLGVAAAMAALGGRSGRRAAVRGLVAIGATSAAVNLGIKPLSERRRPDRDDAGVAPDRLVRMPSSSSFPSGHSASGFAFAAAVGHEIPALAVPLTLAAGAVAYSRVHTGVHYPGDALVGSLLGAGFGEVIAGAMDRVTRVRA